MESVMRSHKSLLLFGALAISIATASCKKGSAEEKAQPAPDTAVATAAAAVRFTKIVERRVAPTLEASGTLGADESSEVASPVAGVVVKVEVDVGSRVKKGDVLVRLDGRDPSLRLAQADAQAAQAMARLGIKPGEKFEAERMADVRAAKEAMDLAVADAARTKALYESGSVAAASWDTARTRAEQARAQYESALNGARQAWASLIGAQAQAGQAQKAVADATIRAPFDGAVAERRITAGEYAQAGRVVAVVVRDRPLRLRLDIPEVDAGKVVLDERVTLSVAAFPGRVFTGTVKRIGASLKTQSRALPIEVEVANAEGELKPGFFARAEIDLGGSQVRALLVPRAAIGTSGSASRVFVRAGNRVVERIVGVGREIDGLVEIRGAVGTNDEVAIEGVDKLADGAEIKVVP